MTLYDMLDKTLYHQEVWIFETDAYDKNMPLFKGAIEDARKDDSIWDCLMNPVEHFECNTGILVIMVRSSCFKTGLEGKYTNSSWWGEAINQRPWRHSAEIARDLQERIKK